MINIINSNVTIGHNNNNTYSDNIIYDDNNTVGPKSISKQEIIKEFNKLFTCDAL